MPNKYGNIKVEVDGIRFASRKESDFYGNLKLRKRAGIITDFKIQVKYEIKINNILVCTYIADFVVYNGEGVEIIDCKGFKTPVYKLKKKLMKAVLGIDIIER